MDLNMYTNFQYLFTFTDTKKYTMGKNTLGINCKVLVMWKWVNQKNASTNGMDIYNIYWGILSFPVPIEICGSIVWPAVPTSYQIIQLCTVIIFMHQNQYAHNSIVVALWMNPSKSCGLSMLALKAPPSQLICQPWSCCRKRPKCVPWQPTTT